MEMAAMDAATQRQQLAAFIEANPTEDCELCKGFLIGNMVEGLLDSGLTSSISWASPNLEVHLNSDSGKAYGQIATSSRVPILWLVTSPLKVSVTKGAAGTATLAIENLATETPAQSMELYDLMMTQAKHQPEQYTEAGCPADAGQLSQLPKATQKQCEAYLESERQVAVQWFKANQKNVAKDSTGKIGKVLNSAWSASGGKWGPVSWSDWGSIVYSMITAAPKKIQQLEFQGKNIIARAALDESNGKKEKIKQYDLYKKQQLIGAKAILGCPGWASGLVAKKAASGWGFGMMFGHGDPVTSASMGKKFAQADANKLVNLFSLCDDGQDAGADPTCGGSTPGRIHWTTTIPAGC